MPFLPEHPRFKGIALPPSGWVLALLLVTYIFIGLIGHDPWKHDDAVSIGIAFDTVNNGNWLVPHLAGNPYPDAPLYYWTSAVTARLFSWLLPVHDAARLASGIFTLLALEFILLASRELHGRDHAAAAPLILAGSIGFLFHAHEAQPMLAALTAHTAAYCALCLLPRRPALATLTLGVAIAIGFLANGLLPVLTLLPVTVYTLWQSESRIASALRLALAIVLALVISALWLFPLWMISPQNFKAFFYGEWSPLTQRVPPLSNTLRYLNLLLWYAWPALPLAAWALWSKRRVLRSKALALPIFSFVMVLLILGLNVETRSSAALLLLPPLVLLAVPGVATLRRGAANAFDWFGMMTFTFLSAVAWIVWSAMVFGWPERLARQTVQLEPGFVGHFGLFSFAVSACVTVIWVWLIVTSPRSPMRGIMHWMAGLTLFWLLIAMLWMPWIDYGKSYRPLSASLARSLPAGFDCIVNANLPDSILASLDYFDGIRTLPPKNAEAAKCHWLLAQGETRNPAKISPGVWRQVWEGKRPGDRHESDKFHLYRR
ncbi:glycosyltransferase family 39 protein [Propionivibrio sp.]|uniref:ArnT family glycosyltransferase n=1 Tax=Propionivibrio sp. TaxID=2212460 RepID=UPI0025F6FF81|nr:glycosyltransferase family 39 protein [Propionivibrio sp.]MBK7355759.1 glycosyltransferase family 39 protein [Propionivibrio sp.]MBK8400577.1 glycosyltransferase family 39 protein [Propionivibrio sp.]MBK8744350.1 glycosyltransferase family 39 protein [Propionivibrio sp.]MBK8895158.1 glycosyltransferase family 39 protein [Propionivibrio sp.]MBL0206936.1 glycosyltransferase family 39 protein [Propionivibrio sp.]